MLLSFMFVLIIPVWSYADSTETGKITKVITSRGSTGEVFVWVNGVDDSTECPGGARWTIEESADPAYKSHLATLFLAYTLNKTVTLYYGDWLGCGK